MFVSFFLSKSTELFVRFSLPNPQDCSLGFLVRIRRTVSYVILSCGWDDSECCLGLIGSGGGGGEPSTKTRPTNGVSQQQNNESREEGGSADLLGEPN